MDSVLAGFVQALRVAGAMASTAETLDAARAVALLGYADRATLKAGLGAALAKTAADQLLHDQVFELYFAPPPAAMAAAPQGAAGAGGTGDAGGTANAIDLPLALARAAQRVGVDQIRFASQVPYFTTQLVDAVLAGMADGMPNNGTDSNNSANHAPGHPPEQLRQQARALVQQRFALHGEPATEAFLTEVAVARPLGRLAPADMDRMRRAINRMAKRLAAKHAHRRRVQLHGRLDVRRTVHASVAHDGVPFKLHFKHRRVDKPRIVALCDVSGSVAAQARFLLLFLYALHDVVGDQRSFAFSNRLLDVGDALQNLPFDDAMLQIRQQAGSGATDYGQAWADLLDLHPDAIDRRTTVLVLGDGRSNHSDPRLDRFAEMADRAKRVVWLCPEPPGRWGSGDSDMLRLRPLCNHMAYCASAADLEAAIDEALAAYH